MNTEPDKIKNRWAIAGIIFAVLSVFFAFIGIIPLSSVVINVIAIYKAGSLQGRGKWLGVVGLVISLIYTLIYMEHYGHIWIP
ncbi:MAG: hypothetical protein COT84_08825 [Chlamydiae bacterium CG10_big_fil_rev_8_21_14_0_10_35_9]|nr:MAG: hypothetical protein COT84_08825 [Chlamydiae bacterium CG10_big_fil_rev_8_21_14_0_10_35_9]